MDNGINDVKIMKRIEFDSHGPGRLASSYFARFVKQNVELDGRLAWQPTHLNSTSVIPGDFWRIVIYRPKTLAIRADEIEHSDHVRTLTVPVPGLNKGGGRRSSSFV